MSEEGGAGGPVAPVVTVSEVAAERLRSLIDGAGVTGAFVRVSLGKRGGARPAHRVAVEDERNDSDLAFEHRGVTLVVDGLQASLLQGSVVDYVDGPGGGHFTVENPNLAPLSMLAVPRRRRER